MRPDPHHRSPGTARFAAGTPTELKRRISGDVVTFEVDDIDKAAAVLRDRPDAREITSVERRLRVTVDRGETQALPLMRALDEAGVKVESLYVAHPSLDDVFLTLTGRSLRDEVS